MKFLNLRRLTQLIHPSYCFYAFIIGIIAGVIFSLVSHQIYFSNIIYIFSATGILLLSFIFPRRFMLLLTLISGIVIANFRVAPELEGTAYLQSLIGKTVQISGVVANNPDKDVGTDSLQLKELKLYLPRGTPEEVSLPGTLYVKLSTKTHLSQESLVILEGDLSDGFGTFVASMFRPKLLSIEESEQNIFLNFKNNFSNTVRTLIDDPEASLGLGYLMGDKSGLSDEFSEQLRNVGMTHVVVASGAHLGILIGATKKIFGRISRFAGALSALLMIFAFASVVGFTPSMTRAVLVTVLSLLTGYVGRKFTPMRLLSLVAAITLFIEPTNFFNLGWQLSFSSFFGIMFVGPTLTEWLYGGKNPPWLASMLLTSISTTLICAPILIYNFGSISLLSLVANLIILPTLPYAMFSVLLTGVTSWCIGIAQIIAKFTTLLLDLHILIIQILSEQKMLIFTFDSNDARIFLLYLPVVILLVFLNRRRRKQVFAPITSPANL